MKRNLFAVCAALCVLTAAESSAQNREVPAERPRPTAEEIAETRTQHLARILSLDEEQTRALRKEQLRLAEQQERMAEERRAYDERMKSLLNEEQYATWQQMRHRPHHPHRRHASAHRPEACPCGAPAPACSAPACHPHRYDAPAPVPEESRGPHRHARCGR